MSEPDLRKCIDRECSEEFARRLILGGLIDDAAVADVCGIPEERVRELAVEVLLHERKLLLLIRRKLHFMQETHTADELRAAAEDIIRMLKNLLDFSECAGQELYDIRHNLSYYDETHIHEVISPMDPQSENYALLSAGRQVLDRMSNSILTNGYRSRAKYRLNFICDEEFDDDQLDAPGAPGAASAAADDDSDLLDPPADDDDDDVVDPWDL